MEFFSVDKDEVIGGYFVSARVTYKYALEHLVPLISRLDIQRDPIKTKLYNRLEIDIVKGCIMPPITVALVNGFNQQNSNNLLRDVSDLILNSIENAFILDGIQRLNTLSRSSKKEGFNSDRALYINFIITDSRDKLLYRMITLNNGQKPMSARHQIDILADAFFDFQTIQMDLVPEKGALRIKAPDQFKKADFVKGYVAYLSGSVNIDNQKIIEEKMDELIAGKIIDNDFSETKVEFTDVVQLIERISKINSLYSWIRNQNNFIGFCVGVKSSLEFITMVSDEQLKESLENLEYCIDSINVSKVNVGKIRKEIVSSYFEEFETIYMLDKLDLLDKTAQWTS